jgi:hypothetical protein
MRLIKKKICSFLHSFFTLSLFFLNLIKECFLVFITFSFLHIFNLFLLQMESSIISAISSFLLYTVTYFSHEDNLLFFNNKEALIISNIILIRKFYYPITFFFFNSDLMVNCILTIILTYH